MEKSAPAQPRPIPPRALAISVAALAVPIVAQFFGEPSADYNILLWLLALVPAFLLAYHRGWTGVATALATGMAVMAVTQAALVALDRTFDNWALLLAVTVAYIGISLAVGWVSELLHRERERAEHMALIDDLTGLPNRRLGRQFLEMEVAAARRGRRIVLVIFDLDNFKDYNDRHGHLAGDRALNAMGNALMANTRKMNLSARWGGEEFMAVLSDSTPEGALVFVKRVMESLERNCPPTGPVTVSAGLAAFGDGMTSADDLIAAADAALYRAKAEGRNRVVVHDPSITDPATMEPGSPEEALLSASNGVG